MSKILNFVTGTSVELPTPASDPENYHNLIRIMTELQPGYSLNQLVSTYLRRYDAETRRIVFTQQHFKKYFNQSCTFKDLWKRDG